MTERAGTPKRVFVAGATGVLGRRVVAYLVAAGHEVTAVARSAEKAELVRELGATPMAVDLFDPEAVREAVTDHDAVVNLATKIPPLRTMALPGAWDENDRIRTEASRNLAAAAVAAGADVFVQESIGFLYEGRGDEWIDETATFLETPHTEPLRAAEAAAASVTEAGGRGIALRFGRFMAPDSDQIALVINAARAGVFIEPGRSDTRIPIIHADDAAAAVVAALDAPAGTYHVVGDDPMTRSEHRAALADAVGRRRLLRPPTWMSRLGGARLQQLYRSQRPSNQRFKQATGWAPRHPDARATYRALAADLGVPRRLPAMAWLALALLAMTGLAVGTQALVDPRGFFGEFPFGRRWVSSDGPFNLHLLRDFAGLNLGIGAVALAALVGRSRVLARAAGGAWLLYSVPHLVYHSLNRELEGADGVLNLVALVVVVVAALAALATPIPAPIPRPTLTPRFPLPRPAAAADRRGGNDGTSRRQSTPDRAASA